MKQLTDTEIIALIRESNPSAFDELHRRYWQELFKLAFKKIGDQEETNDLLQELFIELWDKRDTLLFSNSVTNWLRNRLWFKIAGYFRTKGFKEKHLENFRAFIQQEGEESFMMESADLREADAFYEEILEMVNNSIADMPDRMRQIFVMSKTGNFTVKEIAEKLDISPKTVKTQLERATAKLRKAASSHQPTTMEWFFILWLIQR